MGKEAIPTLLTIKASGEEIISGENAVMLTAAAFYFYGEQAKDVQISFSASETDKAHVRLTDKGDGCCLVEGIGEDVFGGTVIVYATTSEGLEAAVQLTVSPSLLEAPIFVELPKVKFGAGRANVQYELLLQGYEENSLISWYRCKEADGSDGILVAVSGNDTPMKEYSFTREDVGYYLMAKVEPCHGRSHKGVGVCNVSERVVELGDLDSTEPTVEVHNFV